jgi:hypothetical protein
LFVVRRKFAKEGIELEIGKLKKAASDELAAFS